MYVYKMCYADLKYMNEEDVEVLKRNNIIVETDYGTTEIMSDTVQDLEDNKLKAVLIKSIGEELVNMLGDGELDFVLVV